MTSLGKTRDMIAGDLLKRYGAEVVDSRKVHTLQVGVVAKSIEVQYDPYNQRLKFFDLSPQDVRHSMAVGSTFENEEPNELYDKIIVYARSGMAEFQELGLSREATLWGFFRNGDDAELWTKYLSKDRATEQDRETNERAYQIAQGKEIMATGALPDGYTSTLATVDHASEIAALMGDTFDDYPTPITIEAIAKIIHERTSAFRFVRNSEKEVVACASAEIHHTRRSAEMTDCATRNDQRGKGLMSWILGALEEDLWREFGITDAYTIARSVEVGMNCSFAKLGYEYTGRLINNCRMPEGWESMNVWCKSTRNPQHD